MANRKSMSDVPDHLLSEIFRYCTWQDRLLSLRLVDARCNDLVEFGDLRNFRLSDLELLCKGYDDSEISDAWLSNVIKYLLPLIGLRLRGFSFDYSDRRFLAPLTDSATSSILLNSFVKSCPKLSELEFDDVILHPNAYSALELLAPMLEILKIGSVADVSSFQNVSRLMRLRKLKIGGDGVENLTTADDSSITSLFIQDFAATVDEFVEKYPNLRSHGFNCASLKFVLAAAEAPFDFDNFTNRRAYAGLKNLRRSAPIDCFMWKNAPDNVEQWPRLFPNLEQLLVRSPRIAIYYPNLRSLKIVYGQFSTQDFELILSLTKLRKLAIEITSFEGIDKKEWNVGCVDLRSIRFERSIRFKNIDPPWRASEFLQAVFNACSSLEIFEYDKNIDSEILIAYANRLGADCRLRQLSINFRSADDVYALFSQNLPNLRRCNLKLDVDTESIDGGRRQRLIGLRRLKRLDFESRMHEYFLLENILLEAKSLKKLSTRNFENIGHPQMLFYRLGRHSSLNSADLLFNRCPSEVIENLFLSMLDGRKSLDDERHYTTPFLKIRFGEIANAKISTDLVAELKGKRIFLR